MQSVLLLQHIKTKIIRTSRRCLSIPPSRRIVDLRSDTVTAPRPALLDAARTAPTGDDVFQEDPTVQALEEYAADRCGKECGLFLPTATMANLVAVMAHCDVRASEIIMGTHSHMCQWEAGNSAGLAGVFSKQLPEDLETAQLDPQHIRQAVVPDDTDDHRCRTQLLCLENTHNMLGGVALSFDYMKKLDTLCHDELHVRIHLDGARLGNAAIALHATLADVCRAADTVTLCLSKGLGAPLGALLVGDCATMRRARRARKRCGGGMRQAGVVAAMGRYALQHNYERLYEDHVRAQRLACLLMEQEFRLLRQGRVDTNIVFFQLPEGSGVAADAFVARLKQEFGVQITGGYSMRPDDGGFFRAVTHMDVNDEDIAYAANAMVQLGCET